MKILVVEDDPAELAVLAFKEMEAVTDVNVVSDGVEALSYLRHEDPYANSSTPDLILLDLNMPRMVGRAVLVELKSDPKLKQIPVIVLSNSDAEDDIEHIYRHNGNCYVIKPEDMQGMSRFVESLQQFWGERVRFSPGLG
ncbi:MAG: response regulator [Roseibacillus sp.]|jgi:two-component system response regulator